MPELYPCVAGVYNLVLYKDLSQEKFKRLELLYSGDVNLFNTLKTGIFSKLCLGAFNSTN